MWVDGYVNYLDCDCSTVTHMSNYQDGTPYIRIISICQLYSGKAEKLEKKKTRDLCIFIGKTDAEAEASILWPPDVKSRLIEKGLDGVFPQWKDWGQEKKVTEDKMVWWHHWLSGHEFEQTPEESEEQGSLAGFSPRGLKESDTIAWLNNNSSEAELKKKKRQEISARFQLPQPYYISLLPGEVRNACTGFLTYVCAISFSTRLWTSWGWHPVIIFLNWGRIHITCLGSYLLFLV